MKKIPNLLPPRGLSLTKEQLNFINTQIKQRALYGLSHYIRLLVDREILKNKRKKT